MSPAFRLLLPCRGHDEILVGFQEIRDLSLWQCRRAFRLLLGRLGRVLPGSTIQVHHLVPKLELVVLAEAGEVLQERWRAINGNHPGELFSPDPAFGFSSLMLAILNLPLSSGFRRAKIGPICSFLM